MKNLTVEWICALWEQTKITRFLQFVEAGSQEKPEAQGISVKKKKIRNNVHLKLCKDYLHSLHLIWINIWRRL